MKLFVELLVGSTFAFMWALCAHRWPIETFAVMGSLVIGKMK